MLKKMSVWGVFVGDRGDQLEVLNSQNGPFPPEPGTSGYVAIGWPLIGDMELYRNNYPDFIEKFRIVYPHENERLLKTKANMVWNFAFKIQEYDWIMCPSSASGYLLVGKVSDEYINIFHKKVKLDSIGFRNIEKLYSNGFRRDFVHLRKVKWLYMVSDKDPRYAKLHQIGQLTVSQPNIKLSDLQAILNGED